MAALCAVFFAPYRNTFGWCSGEFCLPGKTPALACSLIAPRYALLARAGLCFAHRACGAFLLWILRYALHAVMVYCIPVLHLNNAHARCLRGLMSLQAGLALSAFYY